MTDTPAPSAPPGPKADKRPAKRRRRRRSLTTTIAVVASVSAAGFFAIFGQLSSQMAASNDPALGPKARAVAQASRPPVNRRIIKRTVIVRKVHDPAPAVASSPSSGGSPAPAQSAAPATSSPPAVVQQAPAPAPAPVVTRAS
jgi:hypothetical protein